MNSIEYSDSEAGFARGSFRRTIASSIAACADGRSLAVVVIKMHDLHKLNQMHGYDLVDETIQGVLGNLHSSLKRGTGVCRLSSAMIGLVFEDLRFPHLVRLGLDRVQEILAEPVQTQANDTPIHLRTTVAAALHPNDSSDADGLLLNAECALRSTRPVVRPLVLYEEVQDAGQAASFKLEEDLRAALAANTLDLQYQPKRHFHSGQSAGFEALLRWNHPERGHIPPEVFVAIAESVGLIGDMTDWVVQTALRETARSAQSCCAGVAINVSATTLFDPCFPFVIDSAVSMWDARYECLTLEITENVLMENLEEAQKLLNDFRSKGIRISIDDFGTGYSSLAYFKHLPADEVKIDRLFVTNMTRDVNDQRLVEAIIELAHKFDLSVVAEGIEDEETYNMLHQMGCDVAQGFYISKAIKAETMPLWQEHALAPQEP